MAWKTAAHHAVELGKPSGQDRSGYIPGRVGSEENFGAREGYYPFISNPISVLAAHVAGTTEFMNLKGSLRPPAIKLRFKFNDPIHQRVLGCYCLRPGE